MEREFAKEFYKRADVDKGACPVCNLCYAEDYEPDQRYHRKFHRRIVAAFDPKPDPILARHFAKEGQFIPVGPISRRHLRARLACVARAFRCEFGCDFTQYDADYDDGHGFILADAEGRAIGGTVVRFRQYHDRSASFVMAWVWVAPNYRRQGRMRSMWKFASTQFPGLLPEAPFSSAAAKFFAARMDVPEKVRNYAIRQLEAGCAG